MRLDSLLAGLLIGLLLPFVAYAILLQINDIAVDYFTDFYGINPKGLTVMALCSNLIPFQAMKRRRFDENLRGIVIGTSIYFFAWMGTFGIVIFKQFF